MATLQSINPATGDIVGEVGVTPEPEIPQVVAAAGQAQSTWGAMSLDERAETLKKAGPILRDRVDEIARLGTLEMGKPLKEMRGEVKYVATGWESTIDEIVEALRPEVREDDGVRSTIVRDPFGVVACISPWNFPVLMPHQQVLPALVAGNAVVFKPSEHTPLTGEAYADAIASQLPSGVLQIVHGAETQGKALVAADVQLIVFTGSQAAGKHILGEASNELKRVILELGGKDPLLVLDDADVDAAAKYACRNAFRNAGQVCISTERIYVPRSLQDRFVESLQEQASAMVVGDGLDDGTRVGPMVDRRQKEHVLAQVTDALEHGAAEVWRGEGEERGGNFVSPRILTGVTAQMNIARQETFGPVACIISVDSEDDAIEQANDTPYGLGASVFGAPEHAREVARRLNAGMVGINQGLNSASGTPWVGARQSGYGFHSGPEGHRQFAQVRVLSEPA